MCYNKNGTKLDRNKAPGVILAHIQAFLGHRFEAIHYFNSSFSQAKKKKKGPLDKAWEKLGATVHLFPMKKSLHHCDHGHVATKDVQAGVDVAIAVEIITLLETGQLDHLCFVGGDGDFAPAFQRVAEAHRKPITIASFRQPLSREIKTHASHHRGVFLMDKFFNQMRIGSTCNVTVTSSAPVVAAVVTSTPCSSSSTVAEAALLPFMETLMLLVLLVVWLLQM